MKAADQRLPSRLRAGLIYGAVIGAVFAVFAIVIAVFNGGNVPLRYGGEASLLAVLFSYLVAGPLTGLLFGLLFPLMRKPWGAYLVGVAVSIPFILSVAAGLGELRPWTGRTTLTLVVMALSLGGFGGLIVREVAAD